MAEVLMIVFSDNTTVFQRSHVEQAVRDELDKLDDGSYFDLKTIPDDEL